MEVSFSPNFIRELEGLPRSLREEAIEKIEALSQNPKQPRLKVHKLSGSLKNRYAFSVNYRIRIIFRFIGKPRRAYLLHIGGHEVYDA